MKFASANLKKAKITLRLRREDKHVFPSFSFVSLFPFHAAADEKNKRRNLPCDSLRLLWRNILMVT